MCARMGITLIRSPKGKPSPSPFPKSWIRSCRFVRIAWGIGLAPCDPKDLQGALFLKVTFEQYQQTRWEVGSAVKGDRKAGCGEHLGVLDKGA